MVGPELERHGLEGHAGDRDGPGIGAAQRVLRHDALLIYNENDSLMCEQFPYQMGRRTALGQTARAAERPLTAAPTPLL